MDPTAKDNPFQSPTPEQDLIAPLGDAIVAEGTFTQRDLLMTYHTMVYNWRLLAITGCVSILFFSTTLSRFMGPYWLIGAIAYPLLCLIPIFALVESRFYYQSYWRTQSKKFAAEPQQQRISLDEQGVHFESKSVSATLPWSRFERFYSRRRMLVLMTQPFGWISLPSHFFESRDAFAAAQACIRQHLGQQSPNVFTATPARREEYVDTVITGAVTGEGTLTRREFYYTSWLMVRRNAIFSLVIIITIFGITIFTTLEKYAANQIQDLSIGMIPLIAAILISVRWARYWLAQRRTYTNVTQHVRVRWTITPEKLIASSPTFSLNFQWKEITKTFFRDEMLVLIYQKSQAFALPRRFLASDEDWRQVVEWARQSQRRRYDAS